MNPRKILAALEGIHEALDLGDTAEARRLLGRLGEAIHGDVRAIDKPRERRAKKAAKERRDRDRSASNPAPPTNPALPAPWEDL